MSSNPIRREMTETRIITFIHEHERSTAVEVAEHFGADKRVAAAMLWNLWQNGHLDRKKVYVSGKRTLS